MSAGIDSVREEAQCHINAYQRFLPLQYLHHGETCGRVVGLTGAEGIEDDNQSLMDVLPDKLLIVIVISGVRILQDRESDHVVQGPEAEEAPNDFN